MYVTVRLCHPAAISRAVPVKCLVDTDATYSVVPAPLLRSIGVRPHQQRVFTLADGRKMRRWVGGAAFKLDGHVGWSDVIFGTGRDQPLLGAFSLEALGMGIDPVRKRLKPIRLLLA